MAFLVFIEAQLVDGILGTGVLSGCWFRFLEIDLGVLALLGIVHIEGFGTCFVHLIYEMSKYGVHFQGLFEQIPFCLAAAG